ncbi:14281_t:CDS:2, partial [Dentiscutata heterogama]
MPRKKNSGTSANAHKKSIPSATNPLSEPNESTITTGIVNVTELQELIRQGGIIDKIHEVMSYDRESNPWIDDFINTSMELEKLIFQANYYKNKIEDYVFEFLSQFRENKKEWLTREAVGTLRQVITLQKVMDLLDIAENKGFESP